MNKMRGKCLNLYGRIRACQNINLSKQNERIMKHVLIYVE